MPEVELVNESVVLHQHGWLPLWCAEGEVELIGVDRTGKPVVGTAEVRRETRQVNIVYLGTRLSFSAFSANSRLLTYDGRAQQVGNCIECGSIGDVKFEIFNEVIAARLDQGTGKAMWAALEKSSPHCRSSHMWLPCRDSSAHPPPPGVTQYEVKSGPQLKFCVVRRDQLLTASASAWSQVYWKLGRTWSWSTEAGRVEWDVTQYLFALWYASACRAIGGAPAFVFEALQHSCSIGVDEERGETMPILRGSCGFSTPQASPAVLLAWKDRTWSPLAGGFILAS